MPSRSRVSRWVDILHTFRLRVSMGRAWREDKGRDGVVPVVIAYESETVAGPYDQDAG